MLKTSTTMGGMLLLALLIVATGARAAEISGASDAGVAPPAEQGGIADAPDVPPARPLPNLLPLFPSDPGVGAPGFLSAKRCPELPLSPPLATSPGFSLGAPTLGLGAGTGGALYGQTFGENYGAGPGSVTEQANAILGRNCVILPSN